MKSHSNVNISAFINDLLQLVPSIYAVVVIKGREMVFTTDNWDISQDIIQICSSWDSMNAPFIIVSGIKYTMIQCEIDSLAATSVKGEGHIIGVKDEERMIITYVEPNGDKRAVIVEISRLLINMNSKKINIFSEKNQFKTEIQLENEIENFLHWIKDPKGLSGYIAFCLKHNVVPIISELSKLYNEFRQIFGV